MAEGEPSLLSALCNSDFTASIICLIIPFEQGIFKLRR